MKAAARGGEGRSVWKHGAGAEMVAEGDDGRRTTEDELAFAILLCDRLRRAVRESNSYKLECSDVGRRADDISRKLRSLFCLVVSSASSLYEPPLHRIVSDAAKNVDRALSLVRRWKRCGVLRRVVTITSAADSRKILVLLDASLGDVRWLLNLYNSNGAVDLSLPPIASTDPVLGWVWSHVAVIQMGALSDKIDAANSLAGFALDNEWYKKTIVEQGGVPSLLKLLKEASSSAAQIAAATALTRLATSPDRVRRIVDEQAVPVIVSALSDSSPPVQLQLALLVSTMAANDPISREEFSRENVIKPLISLLSSGITFEDQTHAKPKSIHSLVQINREMGLSRNSKGISGGRERDNLNRHRAESEIKNQSGTAEGMLKLKVHCAEALWMLSKGSISNSRRITEAKGLLCLAKLVETAKGDLRLNCLMTVMEICSVAESDPDFRRLAFKMSLPTGKAVVDQLARLIVNSGNEEALLLPAIRSVGHLARLFPARDTAIIRHLVNLLRHWNEDVAAEAAIALGKFTCEGNFNRVSHSKAVIEFEGILPAMKLLRSGEARQLQGLVLLCNLAVNVGNSEALQRARLMTALELAGKSTVAQYPLLRDLIPKAINSLQLYMPHERPHKQLQ